MRLREPPVHRRWHRLTLLRDRRRGNGGVFCFIEQVRCGVEWCRLLCGDLDLQY
jgi:hypothetical protein